jgi:putative ABC transport system ATP-binding protein
LNPIIRFEAVHKRFGMLPNLQPSSQLSGIILDAAELAIAPGEFVAITGESGCGKSTLLNIIAGLEPIESGRVTVLDQSIQNASESALADLRRTQIGFVFQAFLLLPYLNVERNIALSLGLNGVGGTAVTQRVRELMARLGLTEHAQKMPRQLSGGQTQRVAVARALAHSPAIILADEPTGNLDEASAKEVLALFVQAVREERRTCVLVTHSAQVARQADRVLRLASGKLVSSG